MVKTFFIIPGFWTQGTDDSYLWLVTYLTTAGYNVKCVPVRWRYTTLSQNAAEFLDYFNQHKTERNYIFGFSYGAVIGLLTASQTKPQKLYLCSLSPDFKEDKGAVPAWIKNYIGVRRYQDIETRSGEILAKELPVKTIIFYGEEEGRQYPQLKKRAEETYTLGKNVKLVIVKDSPHDVSYPSYQTAIKREIK